jgi:hypothetical protein
MRPDAGGLPMGGQQPAAAGFTLPAWANWPVDGGSGPDFLATAGGLALIVLGLRVLFGGRGRERLD